MKELIFILNWGLIKFQLFFVLYEILFEGIKSFKYFGDCYLKILKKTESFQNHRLV